MQEYYPDSCSSCADMPCSHPAPACRARPVPAVHSAHPAQCRCQRRKCARLRSLAPASPAGLADAAAAAPQVGRRGPGGERTALEPGPVYSGRMPPAADAGSAISSQGNRVSRTHVQDVHHRRLIVLAPDLPGQGNTHRLKHSTRESRENNIYMPRAHRPPGLQTLGPHGRSGLGGDGRRAVRHPAAATSGQ